MKVTLSLAQALLWKQQTVVAQLQQAYSDLRTNSQEVGSTREVDVKAAYTLALTLSEYLAGLNQILDAASGPSRRLVQRKKELIDLRTNLRGLDTLHGQKRLRERYSEKVGDKVEYEAVLRKTELDAKCAELQRQINKLQLQINESNATIKVELDIPDFVEPPASV